MEKIDPQSLQFRFNSLINSLDDAVSGVQISYNLISNFDFENKSMNSFDILDDQYRRWKDELLRVQTQLSNFFAEYRDAVGFGWDWEEAAHGSDQAGSV